MKNSNNVIDWFAIWYQDKSSMLDTMHRNLAADLNAGYNPRGECAMRQLREISEYAAQFDAEMRKLADMEERKASRWCYVDMLRRGVISAA